MQKFGKLFPSSGTFSLWTLTSAGWFQRHLSLLLGELHQLPLDWWKANTRETRTWIIVITKVLSCAARVAIVNIWTLTKDPSYPMVKFLNHWHFGNCKTFGVVYLLKCDCSCFYIYKTKLPFWKRAYQHIRSMQVCNPDLPLGRHTTLIHRGIFPRNKFLILDLIHPSPRGGDWNKSLLQLDLRWIYMLRATYPPNAVCLSPFWRASIQVEWRSSEIYIFSLLDTFAPIGYLFSLSCPLHLSSFFMLFASMCPFPFSSLSIYMHIYCVLYIAKFINCPCLCLLFCMTCSLWKDCGMESSAHPLYNAFLPHPCPCNWCWNLRTTLWSPTCKFILHYGFAVYFFILKLLLIF